MGRMDDRRRSRRLERSSVREEVECRLLEMMGLVLKG